MVSIKQYYQILVDTNTSLLYFSPHFRLNKRKFCVHSTKVIYVCFQQNCDVNSMNLNRAVQLIRNFGVYRLIKRCTDFGLALILLRTRTIVAKFVLTRIRL